MPIANTYVYRFGGFLKDDPKEVTYYEFSGRSIGWEDKIAKVSFAKRGGWGCKEPLERSTYFKPVMRPVWGFEFAFVGNGWRPE